MFRKLLFITNLMIPILPSICYSSWGDPFLESQTACSVGSHQYNKAGYGHADTCSNIYRVLEFPKATVISAYNPLMPEELLPGKGPVTLFHGKFPVTDNRDVLRAHLPVDIASLLLGQEGINPASIHLNWVIQNQAYRNEIPMELRPHYALFPDGQTVRGEPYNNSIDVEMGIFHPNPFLTKKQVSAAMMMWPFRLNKMKKGGGQVAEHNESHSLQKFTMIVHNTCGVLNGIRRVVDATVICSPDDARVTGFPEDRANSTCSLWSLVIDKAAKRAFVTLHTLVNAMDEQIVIDLTANRQRSIMGVLQFLTARNFGGGDYNDHLLATQHIVAGQDLPLLKKPNNRLIAEQGAMSSTFRLGLQERYMKEKVKVRGARFISGDNLLVETPNNAYAYMLIEALATDGIVSIIYSKKHEENRVFVARNTIARLFNLLPKS